MLLADIEADYSAVPTVCGTPAPYIAPLFVCSTMRGLDGSAWGLFFSSKMDKANAGKRRWERLPEFAQIPKTCAPGKSQFAGSCLQKLTARCRPWNAQRRVSQFRTLYWSSPCNWPNLAIQVDMAKMDARINAAGVFLCTWILMSASTFQLASMRCGVVKAAAECQLASCFWLSIVLDP